MKKNIFIIATVILLAIIFNYNNSNKINIELSKQKQSVERFIKLLEKYYIAGIVDCYNFNECYVENGVSKNFKFSKMYIRNIDNLKVFLYLLERNTKEKQVDFVRKNNLSYYFDTKKTYFNYSFDVLKDKIYEFELEINNLDINDNIKENLAFLSWYVNDSTYNSILSNLENINLSISAKFEVKNNKIVLNNTFVDVKISTSSNLHIIFDNKSLEIKMSNYDSIKPIFKEFNEFIYLILKNNSGFIFSNEILKNLDAILDNDTTAFKIKANNIFDTKNILFIRTHKLESN